METEEEASQQSEKDKDMRVVALHDKSGKEGRVVMRCDKLVDDGEGGD